MEKRKRSRHTAEFTSWHGVHPLVPLFCLWKFLLFSIVALAPGPGYDTSSTLLLDADATAVSAAKVQEVATSLPRVLKFVRWDAIYFSQITERGYLFEQEWAFGPGFPSLVDFLQKSVFGDGFNDKISTTAFIGVALSTFCHLLSVLVLHSLTTTIFSRASQIKSSVPTVIAALHIINPAGAFLLSPYSEALFALLNILGFQLYLKGLRNHYQKTNIRAEIQCLAAGAVFGLATTVRSNGLLSGALFLYDATLAAISLSHGQLSTAKFRRLAVIGVGGCLVALGAIIPQYRVYARYCTLDTAYETRPWCNNYVPSIYAWVQRHYWNSGLFRYWTVSNIPLFLLAAPKLFILCRSSIWALSGDQGALDDGIAQRSRSMESDFQVGCLRRLAVPQALLASMALLSYHVQIITRLSSAYPLWYIWLFSTIRAFGRKSAMDTYRVDPKTLVRWMVIYAMVQAGLFASFLPPA